MDDGKTLLTLLLQWIGRCGRYIRTNCRTESQSRGQWNMTSVTAPRSAFFPLLSLDGQLVGIESGYLSVKL